MKENIKKNIVIFSLLFSLKNNEENIKEKKQGKGEENLVGLLFTDASSLTSSSLVAMTSHRHRPFQRPPLSLRPSF